MGQHHIIYINVMEVLEEEDHKMEENMYEKSNDCNFL